MKSLIAGKNINLRDVELADAAFILSLRTDEKKNKYLSATSNDLSLQEDYIKRYKSLQDMWYFVIETKDGTPIGTVRIYDIVEDSFCWGSWLMVEGAPKTAAIESALLIYEFAFYELGFKKSHFDVRKENKRVVDFHQRFGAKIIRENELDYYFQYDVYTYKQARERYQRFLARP